MWIIVVTIKFLLLTGSNKVVYNVVTIKFLLLTGSNKVVYNVVTIKLLLLTGSNKVVYNYQNKQTNKKKKVPTVIVWEL